MDRLLELLAIVVAKRPFGARHHVGTLG